MPSNKKIKGVLIDTKKNEIKVIDFDYKSYKDFYPLLDCSCFDIQERRFGGTNGAFFDIYLDDEGLLSAEPKPVSIVTLHNGQQVEQIVGNVFICSHNEEGESISLTDEQIEEILTIQFTYFDEQDATKHKGLVAYI